MVGADIKSTSRGNEKELRALLKDLEALRVFVGIPEETAPRLSNDEFSSSEMTNAQLCYLHTNGSVLQHIPARPIIEPAIEAEDNKEAIAEELNKAAESILDKKPEAALNYLKRAGMTGQNAARAWFVDPRNGWPENSPATIAAKGSDRPLIDTGELRKSIIYVIKD